MTRMTAKLNIDADQQSTDAGFGALETERGCLPLIALDVKTRINGVIAETTVRQTFRNALDEPLEATYIFPLPDRAAVSRFQLHVAGRTIDGELQERGQAREEYDRAIAQGHRAAIAEEERSGVFTLRVGNLPPHEEARVELTLVGPLPVADGEATFRFPLVVAPRDTSGIPLDGPSVGDGATPDTDEVPDASRVTPPVLLPGFPNPVRLSLEVEIDPPSGVVDGADWASSVRSSLHSTLSDGASPLVVRLEPSERLNRDFILRFPVAGKQITSSLAVTPTAGGKPGVLALTLLPPMLDPSHKPQPREVVFVLDRSGSMGGWKMVAARRALGRMIDTLLDQDRFTVMAFDQWLEFAPHAPEGTLVDGTNQHRWRMLEWLGKVEARGGTEMGPALTHAMQCFSRESAKPESGVERILVIVTDGQVSGEDAILKQLAQSAAGQPPRVFTVGIDQAVNAGFLQRLADIGRGACELVESEQRLDEAMDRVHRLIGTPVLTDVRLEPVNFDWAADSLAPQRMSDLFVDRPVTVFGRHLCEGKNIELRIHATDAAGRPWSNTVTARPAAGEMFLRMWGRAKVRELEDQYAADRSRHSKKLMQQIVDVSRESHVLSRFTAYVAVDRSEIVNEGGQQTRIIQPVEAPEGWESQGQFMGVPMLACLDAAPMAASLGVPSMRLAKAKMRMGDSDETILSAGGDAAEPVYRSVEQAPIELSDMEGLADSANAKLVNMILLIAIRDGAEEVRFEPADSEVRVTQVIGGKSVEMVPPPPHLWEEMLARLETMAGLDPMKWDELREGKCGVRVGGHNIKLTISSTAGTHGPVVTISIAIPSKSSGPERARSEKEFWK